MVNSVKSDQNSDLQDDPPVNYMGYLRIFREIGVFQDNLTNLKAEAQKKWMKLFWNKFLAFEIT